MHAPKQASGFAATDRFTPSQPYQRLPDKTGAGALHELTITVVTDAAGFAQAKTAAAAVSDALVDAPLILARGVLLSMQFYKAKAARVGTGDLRQINLIFRARVADT